jgi:hypothetical protein
MAEALNDDTKSWQSQSEYWMLVSRPCSRESAGEVWHVHKPICGAQTPALSDEELSALLPPIQFRDPTASVDEMSASSSAAPAPSATKRPKRLRLPRAGARSLSVPGTGALSRSQNSAARPRVRTRAELEKQVGNLKMQIDSLKDELAMADERAASLRRAAEQAFESSASANTRPTFSPVAASTCAALREPCQNCLELEARCLALERRVGELMEAAAPRHSRRRRIASVSSHVSVEDDMSIKQDLASPASIVSDVPCVKFRDHEPSGLTLAGAPLILPNCVRTRI